MAAVGGAKGVNKQTNKQRQRHQSVCLYVGKCRKTYSAEARGSGRAGGALKTRQTGHTIVARGTRQTLQPEHTYT